MLSRCCLPSLLLTATTVVAGSALAGNTVELPSDVSVSLVAEPTAGLEPGDTVTFTISVTNHGPEVVDRLTLSSSFFVDELDVFAGSIVACEGPLLVAVADFIGGYEYWIDWDPVSATDPALLTLDVGETRTCVFNMPLTSAAPDLYPFSFGLAGFLSDLDPSNNSVTVWLRRAPAGIPAPAPVPFSPAAFLILAMCMAAIGSRKALRSRPSRTLQCDSRAFGGVEHRPSIRSRSELEHCIVRATF